MAACSSVVQCLEACGRGNRLRRRRNLLSRHRSVNRRCRQLCGGVTRPTPTLQRFLRSVLFTSSRISSYRNVRVGRSCIAFDLQHVLLTPDTGTTSRSRDGVDRHPMAFLELHNVFDMIQGAYRCLRIHMALTEKLKQPRKGPSMSTFHVVRQCDYSQPLVSKV